MNLTEFVNKTEMVSFGSLVRSIGWFIIVNMFGLTSCIILLRDSETYMTWGIQLAGFVIGGLLGASGIGAYNSKVQRETAQEYAPVVEAKTRAHIAGAAAAAAITEKMADAKANRNGGTKEHAALNIEKSETTVINTDDERGTE